MAVENSPFAGQAEQDDVRRKALLRLGVAGVVTAAALAGLWWLDQSGGGKPEKPVPAALPTPIATAPMQESAPPLTAAEETVVETEPPPSPEQAEQHATVSSAALSATPEAPPPPRVSNVPRTPSTPSAAPRPTPATPATHIPAQPDAATGARFVVQLAVFSKPERARELVDKLRKQGIRAQMETRVHIGPFANHEEAERARIEMRKLGMNALITPAFATK